MDARPVARRSGTGVVRLVIVGMVALVQAFAVPVVDASATAANAWRAALGAGGSNGVATVRQLAAGTGSISLKLAGLKTSTLLPVRIHSGTCSAVGSMLLALPSIRTSTAGAASRTSTLTASQIAPIVAAATSSHRFVIRVGAGSGARCGAFKPIVTVSVTGPSGIVDTGGTRSFTATVRGTANALVTWSVVERGGGTITPAGVYTAPATPGTYTVMATSTADPAASGSARVPVVIPVGRIPGYEVGVDYHAYGTDFIHTAFLTRYQETAVRRTVRTQLQGMADRGATVISTRIWLVNEPGETNFGESWRATFPLSAQEQKNLRAYAQDVAAIRGAGGNRLRLDLCLLWLGAGDYTRGTLTGGLGWTPLTHSTFTSRVETTTDRVIAAVTGVRRPDGLPVVDTIYLDGEVMIGAKANQEWFLTTHYPGFVRRVSEAGFRASVYFNASDTAHAYLDPGYDDVDYEILNGHRAMFWVYRSLRFMADNDLVLPDRVDFSWYVPTEAWATSAALLHRVLDDADATLSTLGLASAYDIAETYYYPSAEKRRELGQAVAGEALASPRLRGVTFWTTPDGGGQGVHVGYPFAIEDFFPPPSASTD